MFSVVKKQLTPNSSVGRALDCSSLHRHRLATVHKSNGHWFDSGFGELYFAPSFQSPKKRIADHMQHTVIFYCVLFSCKNIYDVFSRNYLYFVKYIITECSITSTYTDGATFTELNEYLSKYNFKYISSNQFSDNYPDLALTGFTEFDALFVNVFAV